MKNPGRFKKRDANHKDICMWFKNLNCSVLDLHTVGFGCPDILVGFGGETLLVEIKSKSGELEDSQNKFINEWRGGKVHVVRTVEDVISLFSYADKRAKFRGGAI